MNKRILLPNGKEVLCRGLCVEDKPEVVKLFHTTKEYFILSEGKLPEDAEEFFYDLPPGKQADDKMLFGLFEGDNPVAVADIVKDFPEEGVWMTGLLLVHGEMQKKGLGKALQQLLIDHAKEHGAGIHRVGVLEQNTPALKFWQKLEYKKISTSEPRHYRDKTSRVIVMHYHL